MPDETHSSPIYDKLLVKQMLSFISMLVITVLCQLLKTQGLIMLINVFFGLAVNAAFAIATQVSHLVNTFAMNFKQSIIPQMMASFGANDFSSMHRIINLGTKVCFLLMLMISTPAIFEVDFLLNIWLKTPPEHSSHLVVLVLIYINISSFTYFQYQGVHATGSLKMQQIWMSATYIINIALVYLCFKIGANFDIALYVNMIISVIQCIVNIVYAKKTYSYSVSSFLKGILIPCVITVLIVTTIMMFFVSNVEASLGRFFISLLLSESVILILGYCIILNRAEKEFVINHIKKIRNRKQ